MKVSFALVVSLVLVVVVAVPATAQPATRVRPLDEMSAEALQEGWASSSLFRRLISDLEQSDLIVHVMTMALPTRAAGMTQLSSAVPQHRYVRIVIASELRLTDRIAILGHELQHAGEIARSKAYDTASVRRLYQSIGQRVEAPHEAYETTAAIDAGSQVLVDLRRTR